MDMNNLRTESHVAQKSRRNKLRFQQNSDDPTRHHLPPDPNFEFLRPRFGSTLPDPYVYPSDMLHSIASNPHFYLPHAYVDHDSGSGSVSVTVNQPQGYSDWNVVSYSNIVPIDQSYDQQVEGIQLVDQKNSSDVSANGCAMYNYQNTLQNTLQEVVTSAMAGVGSHVNNQSKNFLEINQSIPCWMNGSDQLGFIGNRSNDRNDHSANENNCVTQRLSLSLSSVPQAKPEFPSLHSGPKTLKTDVLTNSDPKQLMGMFAFGHRSVGPLGPFTGYATILKNSKYLKPAQELLSDNCKVGGQDLVQECDDTRKILEEELTRVSRECGASSSSSNVYGSSEYVVGRSGSLSESYRPEFHHKKAKLLYMQEEVCRRYKQYNQQMQLVIASFETVAGLASATPFVSLALKSVSRHFYFVKNAISEQLAQMKKTFEDLCSPSTTYGSNANDSLCQLKSISFGNQQPLWRPQRGLPERAVSVLKAWLFDHFLHPYPSDADKHMLATQTGLTRNQVSNWFINARVRIWKPMVEEIHTLETKGLANSNPNPNSNPNNAPTDHTQDASHINVGSLTNTQHSESLRRSSLPNEQLWDHEKRSRPDYHIPQPAMDRAFASIIPYPRTTFEAGGVGPVSLTLGLRQNAEHVQQLQVQHENQLRQRFEGQLIHDFVG